MFDEAPRVPTLLEGPIWTSLQVTTSWDGVGDTRLFDLRTGVLFREQPADPVPLRTFRFASLARPGTMALRAEGGMEWLRAGPGLRAPAADGTFLRTQKAGWSTARTNNDKGGAIGAAASQRSLSSCGPPHCRADRVLCRRRQRSRPDRRGGGASRDRAVGRIRAAARRAPRRLGDTLAGHRGFHRRRSAPRARRSFRTVSRHGVGAGGWRGSHRPTRVDRPRLRRPRVLGRRRVRVAVPGRDLPAGGASDARVPHPRAFRRRVAPPRLGVWPAPATRGSRLATVRT